MQDELVEQALLKGFGAQDAAHERDVLAVAGEPGPPVLYRHHACGEIGRVELRCTRCGEPMHAGDVDLLPGPGAAA